MLGTNTFSHLETNYTLDAVYGFPDDDSFYLFTDPILPTNGAGLTLHLQRITGDELELPLGEALLVYNPVIDEDTWYFENVLAKTTSEPHVPLFRGADTGNAPYGNYTDPGTKFGIRLHTVNTVATNPPTISGTPQVGNDLTANTSGITDPNGLDGVSYTYQWIRVDDDGMSNPTNVGSNSTTYTLVADDEDQKLKVKITFTDDAGYAEELTSVAYPSSGTIAGPDDNLATVPQNWSLIPSGLGAGDSFRLLFLTSTKSPLTSTDIATYNTFVQNSAAAGHTDIQDYSTLFKVVGSTAAVDARDNTDTSHTSSEPGVPIYWLNGSKVADNYADFYDGSWDDEANNRTESGIDTLDTSLTANRPATGSNHNGTEAFSGATSRALGAANVRVGRPNVSGQGPLQSTNAISNVGMNPIYALSFVLTVIDAPDIPQLSIADAQADEGDPVTFTVTADNTSTADITVAYATSIQSGDTAESNDFTAKSGTLTITAGNTSGTFQVQTEHAPDEYEGDETFTVTLSNPEEATIANATAKGTIRELQQRPQLSFPVATHRMSEISNDYHMLVDVSPYYGEAFNFNLEISGSAQSGTDYVTVPTTQAVAQNQDQLSILIRITNDAIYEGEERSTFRITVNHPDIRVDQNADTFQLIIDDNDPQPTLRATAYRAGTEGGQNQGITPVQGQDFANVVFKLEMQGGYGMNLPVSLDTVDGTAVEGEDFQLNTTSVTFTPQNKVRYVKVPVIDDDEFQGGTARTFQLKVSSANSHFIPHPPVLVTGAIKDNEEPAEGEDYVPQGIISEVTINVGQSWIKDTQIKGRIEHQNDQDWYRTELQKNHCYQIDIWGKEMYEHFKDNTPSTSMS